MSVTVEECYVCSDNKVFLSQLKAETHEEDIISSEIDKLFFEFANREPLFNYKNHVITLVEFMIENADKFIDALNKLPVKGNYHE